MTIKEKIIKLASNNDDHYDYSSLVDQIIDLIIQNLPDKEEETWSKIDDNQSCQDNQKIGWNAYREETIKRLK